MKMIKNKKYNIPSKENFYRVTLILDGHKVIDAQCECKWGQVHKKAYKEGDTICKHIQGAMIQEDLIQGKEKKCK